MTIRLRSDLENAGTLELPQSARQQRSRESRRPIGDLIEGVTSGEQVAKDDWRPSLCDYF
jgi:hypothetical protein